MKLYYKCEEPFQYEYLLELGKRIPSLEMSVQEHHYSTYRFLVYYKTSHGAYQMYGCNEDYIVEDTYGMKEITFKEFCQKLVDFYEENKEHLQDLPK